MHLLGESLACDFKGFKSHFPMFSVPLCLCVTLQLRHLGSFDWPGLEADVPEAVQIALQIRPGRSKGLRPAGERGEHRNLFLFHCPVFL